MFEDYGPTPRICIDFVNNPDLFVGYKRLFDVASSNLSMHKHMDIIKSGKLLDMDAADLTVYLISRRDTHWHEVSADKLVQPPSLDFITDNSHIKSRKISWSRYGGRLVA